MTTTEDTIATKVTTATGKTIQGIIVSNKNDQTIIVQVHSYKSHPKYHKRFRQSKKFHAHDQNNEGQVGNEVIIRQCRPLSKMKRWKLEKIIK